MPSVTLDCNFTHHPKVEGLSVKAQLLYIYGLLHAKQYETDGRLTFPSVRRLRSDVTASQAVAKELVACGLWEQHDECMMIHDYLDYNPSAKDEERQRDMNAERQRQWRQRQEADANVTPLRNGKSNDNNGSDVTDTPPSPPLLPTTLLSPPTPPRESSDTSVSSSSPPKANGDLFRALAEAEGYPDLRRLTNGQRGRIGKAAKEITGAGGLAGDVPREVANLKATWPDIQVTANAVLKYWGKGPPAKEQTEQDRVLAELQETQPIEATARLVDE